MKLFFFDTETTGLNPDRDRIIQFWAIFWTLDEKTGKFHEERLSQSNLIKNLQNQNERPYFIAVVRIDFDFILIWGGS